MQSDVSLAESGLSFQNKFQILTFLVWASWLMLLVYLLFDQHGLRMVQRILLLIAHPLPWLNARHQLRRIAGRNAAPADADHENHTAFYVLCSACAALWLVEAVLFGAI